MEQLISCLCPFVEKKIELNFGWDADFLFKKHSKAKENFLRLKQNFHLRRFQDGNFQG